MEGTQRPDEAWEGPCLPAQQVPRPGEVEAGSWPSVYKGQSPVPQGYASDPEEVRKPAVSASVTLLSLETLASAQKEVKLKETRRPGRLGFRGLV